MRLADVKTNSAPQLMKTKIVVGGSILMLVANSIGGAENAGDDLQQHYGSLRHESVLRVENAGKDLQDYYRAGEFSVDGFGGSALGESTIEHASQKRVRQNIRMDAGGGVNYFITRNFGIGADGYSENTSGNFVDSASVSLILRLPVGKSRFAPYVFGGGGYQFDLAKTWFAQVGAGMEYRFTPHVGVFADARWVLPDNTQSSGMVRLGMRFAF